MPEPAAYAGSRFLRTGPQPPASAGWRHAGFARILKGHFQYLAHSMADEQQEAIEFDGLSNEGTADESETELTEAAEDPEQIKILKTVNLIKPVMQSLMCGNTLGSAR
jgi:hypothetical protein